VSEKNRREHFRIVLRSSKCIVEGEERQLQVTINDLSVGGFSFVSPFDVFRGVVSVSFSLGGEMFNRQAEILRKYENENGSATYAAKFIDYTDRERARLNSRIMQLDAQRW